MKKTQKQTSGTIKAANKIISHEVEPINTPNSQENIENSGAEREKDVTLQNQ